MFCSGVGGDWVMKVMMVVVEKMDGGDWLMKVIMVVVEKMVGGDVVGSIDCRFTPFPLQPSSPTPFSSSFSIFSFSFSSSSFRQWRHPESLYRCPMFLTSLIMQPNEQPPFTTSLSLSPQHRYLHHHLMEILANFHGSYSLYKLASILSLKPLNFRKNKVNLHLEVTKD